MSIDLNGFFTRSLYSKKGISCELMLFFRFNDVENFYHKNKGDSGNRIKFDRDFRSAVKNAKFKS